VELFIIFFVLCFVGGMLWEGTKRWGFTPEARMLLQWGPSNPALVCPHCQTPGTVRIKAVTQKTGISGGKATAALLTGGVSLLATGLARKAAQTQAHCDTCAITWII
jgi:hypothetical protein